MTSPVAIAVGDLLYFEFPTASADGTTLFGEDLGLGLNEGAQIDVDLIAPAG